MKEEVASPCIGVCTMKPAMNCCIGCGRSLQEIADWPRLSDMEKKQVLARLPERLRRLEQEKYL